MKDLQGRTTQGGHALCLRAALGVACRRPACWRSLAGGASDRPPRASCASAPIPNNLPFSNERGEGFENRIAQLLAQRPRRDRLAYTWWAQRRGFVRKTLKAGLLRRRPRRADGFEHAAHDAPYYRSTYVFVPRAGGPDISSFDDRGCATAASACS